MFKKIHLCPFNVKSILSKFISKKKTWAIIIRHCIQKGNNFLQQILTIFQKEGLFLFFFNDFKYFILLSESSSRCKLWSGLLNFFGPFWSKSWPRGTNLANLGLEFQNLIWSHGHRPLRPKPSVWYSLQWLYYACVLKLCYTSFSKVECRGEKR